MKHTKKKSIKINIIFNTAYQLLVLIIPFITSPYIARVLLPAGQGSYSFVNSVVSYFCLIASFGFTNYGTVLVAKNRENKSKYSQIVWELILSKAFLTGIIGICYLSLVGSNVIINESYPLNTKQVYYVLSLMIFSSAFDITFLFQGLENFGVLCLRNVFIKLLNITLLFCFVRNPNDYFNYVIIMTISSALSSVSTLLGIYKNVDKATINFKNLFHHFKSSFVYFIPTCSTTIFVLVSKTLLGSLEANPNASGYYDAADKLITIVNTIILSLNSVLLSRMTYLYEIKDQDGINNLNRKICELFWLVALPCFFGLLSINRYFTPAFFGADFSEAIVLVYLLLPKILISPVYSILSSIYFIPNGRLWQTNLFLFLGFVFNLIFTTILTIFFSVEGTAIASSLSELFLSCLFFIFSRKKVKFLRFKSGFWKCFSASICMFLVCFFVGYFINGYFTSLWIAIIQIISGVLVYGILVLVFRERIVTENLKNIVEKIKNRKKN